MFGIDWDAPLATDNDVERVSVPAIDCPLTPEDLLELQTSVPLPIVYDDYDYGIGYYMESVRFIESHVDGH